jgi:molybdate transport system permease protein
LARRIAHPSKVTTPAGPGVHLLSAITLTFLAIFVGAIILLILVGLTYGGMDRKTLDELLHSREIHAAIRLSAITSFSTLGLVILFCIPVGYALSRYRFPGHSVIETLIDLPILMPPVVIGVTLLIFFATPFGQWLTVHGFDPHSAAGIVLCQFLVSASYAVRAAKTSFDAIDVDLEHVALSLGCTHWSAFWRVSLPMASSGVTAGCIMAWARAVGVFGPLMVFVGSMRMKTEVMPTTVYLELTIGRIEIALAVSMMMLATAGVALVVIHRLSSKARWWGG